MINETKYFLLSIFRIDIGSNIGSNIGIIINLKININSQSTTQTQPTYHNDISLLRIL